MYKISHEPQALKQQQLNFRTYPRTRARPTILSLSPQQQQARDEWGIKIRPRAQFALLSLSPVYIYSSSATAA